MLRKKELKLIYEIDSNYRKPYLTLGKKVHLSEQLISYKVNSFHKKGIIQGYYPLLDYSRFGYLSFIVYFKAYYLSEHGFAKLIEKIKHHENITSIVECDGKYDLMLVFKAKNPSSFNKMLKKLIAEHPHELRNYLILTSVVEHHFLRNYLLGKEGSDDTVIGGDREEIPRDETNMKIIHSLVLEKKKIIDLARDAEITPKTALSRLRELEKAKIIKGYRTLLHLHPLGISTNYILIKYHNAALEKEEQFRQFCKFHPHIVAFTKTLGEWDVLLQVETMNLREFRKLYLEIREKFEDIIEDFDNFRVFMVHKKQFLPEEAFTGPESGEHSQEK